MSVNSNKNIVHRSHRLLELDALRGIAVLWVVLYHFTSRYGSIYRPMPDFLFHLPHGRHGVHLFFMISGFVILMTIDRTKSITDFAVARFARLYPAFWTAALITFISVYIFGLPGRQVSLKTALVNLTMIQGALGFRSIDGSYWSLQVEIFFYCLMAFIVFIRQRRFLTLILSILVLINLIANIFGVIDGLPTILRALRTLLVLEYLHLFLLGIVFYQMRSAWRLEHWLIICLCLAAIKVGQPWGHFLFISILALLTFLATQYEIKLLANRVLVYFGTISYSLYLVHQNLGYILIRYGETHRFNSNLTLALTMLLVCAVASVLTFYIEQPANRLLRGLYQRFVTSTTNISKVVPQTAAAK